MTKEELEEEAEEYFKSIGEDYNEEYERTGKRHYFVGFDIKNGYLAGAEPREKRIAKLEAQIENMKCCGNCEHATHDSMNGTFCNYYSEWEHADLKCTQWELRR